VADAAPAACAAAALPQLRPRWSRVWHAAAPLDGTQEIEWLNAALEGESSAVLWQGARGLVVPGSYRRHADFEPVCAQFAARGWPVRVRRSGGGLVPQGPGIVNVSLAYATAGPAHGGFDAVYLHLCGVLARALQALGIEAGPRTVTGSFCDGRYNLAVGTRKIAGTAQYWRRAKDRHAVLAHALLLVDADVEQLTHVTNQLESALQSGRVYRADALTSVMRELSGARHNNAGSQTQQRVLQALVAALN
jgi:lipoate-protein ligase A